jgi:hypothetical protein
VVGITSLDGTQRSNLGPGDDACFAPRGHYIFWLRRRNEKSDLMTADITGRRRQLISANVTNYELDRFSGQ